MRLRDDWCSRIIVSTGIGSRAFSPSLDFLIRPDTVIIRFLRKKGKKGVPYSRLHNTIFMVCNFF